MSWPISWLDRSRLASGPCRELGHRGLLVRGHHAGAQVAMPGAAVEDQAMSPEPQSPPADRFAVVDAMTQAAIKLGWLPISAESNAKLIMITVRPRA